MSVFHFIWSSQYCLLELTAPNHFPTQWRAVLISGAGTSAHRHIVQSSSFLQNTDDYYY